MKRLIYSLLALIFLALPVASAASCLTSSEEFAAEVVVPNYDLQAIASLGRSFSSSIVASSQYDDKSLLVILSEVSVPRGLSIRLQRPTEAREVTKPHLKFISYSAAGMLRQPLAKSYYGWDIQCAEKECAFEKEFMAITAPRESSGHGVAVEINEALTNCSGSCSGFCMSLSSSSYCIPAKMKQDLDAIFKYANLSLSFRDALSSYRLVGTDGIAVRDIVASDSKLLDWREAMRQEMVYLDAANIIDISKNDIEKIALLAEEGRAGNNYRIVFDEPSSQWEYYDRTLEPLFSSERDCKSYESSQKTPKLMPQKKIGTFYVIPIMLGAIGIVILIALIVIARIIMHTPSSARKNKAQKYLKTKTP